MTISAADFHRVSSGAVAEGAGRAHAATARRTHDGGDRPRISGRRADDRATNRPREANAHRSKVPFEVPRGAERDERLASVLEVIYLVFNEGYAATAGEDGTRLRLCEEALRLGRVLAESRAGGA